MARGLYPRADAAGACDRIHRAADQGCGRQDRAGDQKGACRDIRGKRQLHCHKANGIRRRGGGRKKPDHGRNAQAGRYHFPRYAAVVFKDRLPKPGRSARRDPAFAERDGAGYAAGRIAGKDHPPHPRCDG